MGALLGVAAKGRNGEVIINNVVSVEVPLAVTHGIKKAVGTAKTAAKATASTVGSGLDWAKNQAKVNCPVPVRNSASLANWIWRTNSTMTINQFWSTHYGTGQGNAAASQK